MATGDVNDFIKRIKQDSLAPWFGDDTPNLDAFLTAFATSGAFIYQLKEYLKAQTRIKTSTGFFLDLVAKDYFGDKLLRRQNENDDSYRNRILANLILERATRTGLYQALLTLTGRAPILFEPWNVQDTNALNGNCYLNNNYLGGSVSDYAYTGFIIAYRPKANGQASGGLNRTDYALNGNIFLEKADNQTTVTDQDILDTVQRFKAEGVQVWTLILD